MGFKAAVITVSDRGYRGEREDTSGPALCAYLIEHGYEVTYTAIVPDEMKQIREALLLCADEMKTDLIITCGGTGFSKRDVTPEATKAVLEKETPGIPECMRAKSLEITPRACLSRSAAGIRGDSLIINLPGSRTAAIENISAVIEAVEHGLFILHADEADCGRQNAGKKER
ncbi:MAG: MogA/MoaB family molybdenum cofactor biosynthesis protein [Lachnospiraceae bacterium]|nr:MogA/MoaB family molybdenum cofactor biosynthesis protein [Lachnospiraceae bacterium]